MLGAVRASFRSLLLPNSRAIIARGYHSPIPLYRPCFRKSTLWYRQNGTPRSKLIGVLNASFVLIYVFTANAKSNTQMTADALSHLLALQLYRRDFDFSKIKDSLDFFFIFIAQDEGDVKEDILDMLKTSQSDRDRLQKHLKEYCEMGRNWKEDPVKTGFALSYKKKQIISDMELRLLELPAVEVERPFHESPYEQGSLDGKTYEEVG